MKTKFILVFMIGSLCACTDNPGNIQNKDRNPRNTTSSGISNTITAVSLDSENNDLKGYKINIEKATLNNTNFRKVIYTGKHLQLVLMCLKPGEEIGEEIHAGNDQFFHFESGTGKCIINENEYEVEKGDVIVVPAGAKFNVINTDAANGLKMYSLYGPPHHKDGTVTSTKKEASANRESFDGKTTE